METDKDPAGPFDAIPIMPPAIAAAVVKVMANVKRLQRTDENRFAKYMYTSIDNFLESTGPLCAAAGLLILADESEVEITQSPKADREGTSNFLRVRWAFTLAHASGVIYGPLHRTVIVPASGAQAFGSSQSYALKQFMRGLFQIPTGDDDDPDSQEKRNLPANQATAAPRKAPAAKPPAKGTEPPSKTLSQEEAALKAVADAGTIGRVLELETAAKERITDKAVLGRVLGRMGTRIAYLLGEVAKTETKNDILASWATFIPTCGLLTPEQQKTAMQALLAREQELSEAATA